MRADQVPTIFLCHAREDAEAVHKLYYRLVDYGVSVWLDKKSLVPGEDWSSKIEEAVQRSPLVAICLSKKSVSKEGYVQREIRTALRAAELKPDGKTYIIPVRLEECSIPSKLSHLECVDIFDSKDLEGFYRLVDAIDRNTVRNPDTIANPSDAGHVPPERVFGKGPEPIHLVSGGFVLHPYITDSILGNERITSFDARKQLNNYPLFKPSFGLSSQFSATNMIGISEVRAWSYLFNAFGSPALPRRLLGIIDTDNLHEKQENINILALGAYSNIRCKRIVQDSNNRLIVPALYELPNGNWDARFITKDTSEPVHAAADGNQDYCLVMRISPCEYPGRTWIFCGGLGEWGTSGGAYYLANRWKQIAINLANDSPHFAALIEVQHGFDSSAKLLWVTSDRMSLPTFPIPEHKRLIRFDSD